MFTLLLSPLELFGPSLGFSCKCNGKMVVSDELLTQRYIQA